MVARLWLKQGAFFRLTGYLSLLFRRLLDRITRVPANVPRELTGVKDKAHNMLWISALDHRMSHPLCSQWPK
jgi:hypothetical protein